MSRQMTLKRPWAAKGRGLHTGQSCSLRVMPAGKNEGFRFVRTDLEGAPSFTVGIPGRWTPPDGSLRTTAAGPGDRGVKTVEHLMAAFWALGVSSAHIECGGPEIPALDGSSRDFIRGLSRCGIRSLGARRAVLEVAEPIFVSRPESAILVLPSKVFKVTYTLDYPYPGLKALGESFVLSRVFFRRGIAAARTFCALEEAKRLKAAGFGRGALFANTLVMGSRGPVKNRLRFRNEPVRHKILDLVGDLALLGFDIRAGVYAVRSGHAMNHELAGRLAARWAGQA